MADGGLPINMKMYFLSRGGSGADPSGPIWLLKKMQPNLRTSRDGNYQGRDIFGRHTLNPECMERIYNC
jgi:hypothetical protein